MGEGLIVALLCILGRLKIKTSDFSLISSRRNPLVRRLKALSSPRGRNQSSMLLLEGTHLLSEALKTCRMPSEIVVTPQWLEENKEIFQAISKEVQIHLVTKSVLEASVTTVSPDGVASLFPFSALPKNNNEATFILALDRLQDPGNLGTLFRTALAADVELIWLALGADPLGQKVLRASAGAVMHLPFERLGSDEDNAIEALSCKLKDAKLRGFQVLGAYAPNTIIKTGLSPYWEIDWQKPTVLVLGNEGAGVHPKIQSCCTNAVTLPHNKIVESLNVASDAVPLLLERLRARMTS